ncbi:MAG: feruloyl-CoA synthase [Alphaproteobacteria bacterium]|nr:feruloyl-CoA synthase [Alphaproteobacteria bacterium]MCB9791487.1 feruloyl-CoA synthase [Alphaproteobacteria bacterium]
MLSLAPVSVLTEARGDVLYLRSGHPLAPPPRCLGDALVAAATRAPERTYLAERLPSGALREVSWGQALAAAEAIGARLAHRLPQGRPVLVLSGNSVDHALLTLAGYLVGVPIAPLSVAWSLMSKDFGKLRHIAPKLDPGLIFVSAKAPFAPAVAAVEEVLGGEVPVICSAEDLPAWMAPPSEAERAALEAARARVGPDTVAKILFTSGSTGFPKGVINTHGMLCANQQMIRQLWPFLEDTPPVMVDWLPWSHTFGGNHNFNMALFHAGTLLVDEGKPTPALVGASIRNLRALPPTLYFNVPAGFAALVPHLEADPELREVFFSRLRLIFYAGAALPDDLWQRLVALARQCTDTPPLMTTAWGSTETSPMATSAHFPLERAGNIGVPAPGVTLKLVPDGSKLEVRVKGPHVMPGYLDEPELTRQAFDEEGFYRIGDGVKLADPADPGAGLLFDGRVTEDFKLTTGTWINVGGLRTELLSACSPALQDLVVTGHDREALGVMAWPSVPGCRALVGAELGLAALCQHEAVRAHVREAVQRWNAAHPQSSKRVARLLLLKTPADIDAGEITDKGYINQRAVLERRAEAVARVYAGAEGVMRFG